MNFIDVNGWEGFYKINPDGDVLNVKTGNIKKPDKNSCGYWRVTLQNKHHNPSIERHFVHRLVAEHFIQGSGEVNHIDSDKDNNNVSNLEWCTRKENELHSRMYGNKEYKPFNVKFDNGKCRTFNVKQDLANMIGVTKELVKLWLHEKSKTYARYGINEITYCTNKCLTTSENI